MHRILSLKKRLVATKNVIKNMNIEALTRKLTPFQKTFFYSQFKNASRKPYGRVYNLDSKIDAIFIWKLSPMTCSTLNRLGFCLPSVATLQRLLRYIPLRPGVSDIIFNSDGSIVANMNDKENFFYFDI